VDESSWYRTVKSSHYLVKVCNALPLMLDQFTSLLLGRNWASHVPAHDILHGITRECPSHMSWEYPRLWEESPLIVQSAHGATLWGLSGHAQYHTITMVEY